MKKGDKYILAFILVIICVFGIYQYVVTNFSKGEKIVEIKLDGKVYKKISLNSVKENQTLEIKTENGYNVLEVDKTGAVMVSADCPDQVCVKTGKITKKGPVIACLPHKLSVEIVSDSEDGLDAISK